MMWSVVALLALAAVTFAGPLAPARLRVEYRDNPKGIDVSYPLRLVC